VSHISNPNVPGDVCLRCLAMELSSSYVSSAGDVAQPLDLNVSHGEPKQISATLRVLEDVSLSIKSC